MTRALFVAAAVISVPLFVLSLVGWRAGYAAPSDDPFPGVRTVVRGSDAFAYAVDNSGGRLTVEKLYRAGVPNTPVLSFPWWAPALGSTVCPALLIVGRVRRRRHTPRRGFPLDAGLAR